MTSRNSSNVVLGARDLAVIYYTWQNRLMLTRQYQRKFWSGRGVAVTAARLARLREQGLLTYSRVPWLPEPVLYSSSLAGNRALIQHGLPKLPDPPIQERDFPARPADFTSSMKHDLGVVDIRIALEESGMVERWVSDHQLRLARRQSGDQTRTPDGLFQFEFNGTMREGILEYERVGYRETRYTSVLTRLKALHPDATVFFVATSAGRLKTVRRWAEKTAWIDSPALLQFADFEDVVMKGFWAGFRDLQGKPLGMRL